MKKLLCILIAFGFVAAQLVLANGSAEKSGTTPAKQITLQWMAHPAYAPSGSDPNRVAYLKAAIGEWQKKHPNVTLKSELLSTNGNEAMAKLLEQAADKHAPDVSMIDSFVFTRFVPYLQPLDALMAKYGLKKDDFFDFSRNLVTGKNGQFYGLQFTTDARVLFYRKDLVPTPPKTWAELLNVAKKLKADGYVPILMPAGRGEGAAITSIYPFFWGQGGKLVDANGKAVFGTGANKEKMLSVLTFIQTLVKDGDLPARAANYGAESNLNSEVATGKIAMFMGGNWQVSQLKGIIGKAELAKWAIAPIPQRAANEGSTADGGWVWGIFTSDPVKKDLAFSFVDSVYVGDPGMAKWTSTAGYLPTRKSVYDQPDFVKNAFTSEFRKIVDTEGHLRPVAAVYPKISLQLQIALSSVVSGSKSPTQALDDAWTAVEQQ